MNNLDSRSLRYGDTFAQRFSKPCRITYRVGAAAWAQCADSDEFVIEVKQSKAKDRQGIQHTVMVRLNERELVADPPALEIEAGDVVMWSADGSTVPGFAVSGRSAQAEFDSAALMNESLYTHAFGVPGDYHWEDANGGGLSGTVRVVMPTLKTQHEADAYRRRLATGAVVQIKGAKVEPEEVEIVVGQTVFWVVEQSDGITITDCRLEIQLPAAQRP
jgi:plastocyanin